MLSVIICTYNPIFKNLNRVLDSLKLQTLDKSLWELRIIDNNSNHSFQDKIDLSWHPSSFFHVEKSLGLVKARMLGIKESKGDLLVFVDDDNVLSLDYLETAWRIASDMPHIGAYGGNAIGEFEKAPSKEVFPYLEMIAVRNIPNTIIANLYEWRNTPAGAGLVIRKVIADKYVELLENSPFRLNLDRQGASLMSSGDIDLAYTAIDLGYFNGLFPELKFNHIIPSFRVEHKYLIKLQKYNIISNNILEYIRFKKWPIGLNIWNYLSVQIDNLIHLKHFEYKIEKAKRKGFLESIQICMQIRKSLETSS